jgi:outer membrane protein assembly factor BamB
MEPPPVRRKPADSDSTNAVSVARKPVSAGTKKKRNLWIISTFAALMGALVVGVVYFVVVTQSKNEETLRKEAEQVYARSDPDYRKAALLYRALADNFPDSEHHGEYVFLRDFSPVRAAVYDPVEKVDSGLGKLRDFLDKHKDDPALPKYQHADVAQTWVRLLERLIKLFDDLLPVKNSPEDRLAQLVETRNKLKAILKESEQTSPGVGTPHEVKKKLGEVEQGIAYLKIRKDLLERLRKLPRTPEEIRQAQEAVQVSEFVDEPLVKQEFVRLWDATKENIRYEVAQDRALSLDFAAPAALLAWPQQGPTCHFAPILALVSGPEAALAAADDALPGLVAAPRREGTPAAEEGTIFALARGVLYALSERSGHVRWATRVGIDTTALPVRLPPTDTSPELALVLSADTNRLTARRVDNGKPVWEHSLGQSPCLGQPVVVGRRAYLGTLDGRVEEIELLHGRKLGEFKGCLPLPVGGTHQEGSDLLYFPAENKLVYVFDIKQRKLAAVLESGHPNGSLRGAPLVVGGPAAGSNPATAARYLVLSQTDGLHAMKLRVFALPVGNSPPTELSLEGWPWFAPFCDGEKLAVATDAGVLGLFGIKQPRSDDPVLYPLLTPEVKITGGSATASRAQLVHATETDFWVLARGQFQQYRIGLDPSTGLRAAPVWSRATTLGSPLHAGQVSTSGELLFVVTQEQAHGGCQATAVEASTGNIRWQRQLGLISNTDPAVVGEQVLALDQGGSLVSFDSSKQPDRAGLAPPGPGQRWSPVPAEEGRSFLLPADDGMTVYVLTAGKDSLLVRVHRAEKGKEMQTLSFRAALGGTPALGPNYLVLPAADGRLLRQPLTTDAPPEGGLTWRASYADAGALGHVAHLSGDDFLVTDGSTGLRRISWPREKPIDTPKFEHRIVAAPAVLPATANGPRVCVADSSGTLTLLEGEKLVRTRTWSLGGPITMGPFVRGGQVGCVIDRKRLVWIHPEMDGMAWEYTTPGAGIVGQPQRIGDRILVTDLAGLFYSLDATDGHFVGPGLQLRSRLAPATAAVAFGPGRLFAPLTDGTVLLLRLEWVQGK